MSKKTFVLSLLMFSSITLSALAQDSNKSTELNMFDIPYYREMLEDIKQQANKDFITNKKEVMELLRRTENYTTQEYNEHYANYESNPPFIEKNGIFELNPDYIGKNKKYIEEDGLLVENKEYVEQTFDESTNPLAVKMPTVAQTKKRLGTKSFKINPDLFSE